jgi:penicillin-binding protein 1A
VLEIVSAYTPFANGGFAASPHVVERVRTAHGGKTLYARVRGAPVRVVDNRSIGMMNAMMRETVTSGTARRADLPGWPVAGKTGTSQEFRDAWFIGFTSQLVAGVWLGNDDNTPMKKITGGGLPVEVWSEFMRTAHRGRTPSELPGAAIAAVVTAPGPLSGPSFSAPSGPSANPPPGPSQGPSQGPPPPRRREAREGRQAMRPMEPPGDDWYMDRWFAPR